MRRTALTFVALIALAASGLEAQTTARARAEQVLPPEVFRDLVTLADEMAPNGIPDEPLFNKALEGMAKRVPPDRLLPAVRAYAGRLGQARGALGAGAGVPLLVAGADALQRGVTRDALRSLPADRPRSPMALLVLAELVESGVPTDRAIAIVRQAMQQQTADARMLDIPARVRRLIREGATPREAVDRVRRALQRDRGGNVGPPVPPGSEPLTDKLRDRLRARGGA
jgi:hypothetical protein